MKKLLLYLSLIPLLVFGQNTTETWPNTTLIVKNVTVTGTISGFAELEFESVAQMKAFDFSQTTDGARISCNGYTVANDQKFGPDVFWDSTSSTSDNGVTVFDPATAGNGRLIRIFNGPINVLWGGAAGSGTVDDLAEILAVIAIGKPVYFPTGNYLVTDAITPQSAQRLFGDDRTKSVIDVDEGTVSGGPAFNMAANGVIISPASEPGVYIHDLGVEFVQPSGSGEVRANMHQYPPAIYAVASPRTIVDNFRVTRGWDGLEVTGNSGGTHIGRVELGCFNVNINIDASLDFMHGESWHIWPFGSPTGDLLDIWQDGGTKGVVLGDIDGLSVDKIACFSATVELAGVSSVLPLNIGTLQLDGSNSELVVTSGGVLISNLYSTKSTTETVSSILVSGGRVDISNAHIEGAEVGYQIEVTGGRLSINGGEIYQNRTDQVSTSVSAGQLSLTNMTFRWPNSARTEPLIEQSGTGVLIVSDCRPDHYTTATELIDATTDVLGNWVDAVSLEPHTLTLPATLTTGKYFSLDTWTASMTCSTPGDLSVAYGTRTGFIKLDGDFYDFHLRILFTPTFTTASGSINFTGFTIVPATASEFPVGMIAKVNLNANFTAFALKNSASGLVLQTYGDNQALTNVAMTDLVSGVEVSLLVTGRGKI